MTDSVHQAEQQLEDGVQATMSEVLVSSDPLDATDFDSIEYLNSKFSTERALSSSLDGFIAQVSQQIGDLDEEISRAVHAQAEAGARASRDIGEARMAMTELHSKIGEIKEKAEESESIVREICRDIKELDCAKKNLVASITALKRVNMLTTGVSQLRRAEKSEAAHLLEAIANILQHFEPYGDVPRVNEVKTEVSEIRASLEVEVLAAFREDGLGGMTVEEACAVLDALGAREKQIEAFVEHQLAPYEQLFPKGGEFSSLDDAERRFAWMRRLLKNEWGYPEDWRVELRVVQGFAKRTKAMFLEILQYESNSNNVAVVLKALQKSLIFEKEARARFGSGPDEVVSLSDVFDPFMGPYVALEKQNLADALKTDDSIDDQGALPVFSSSVQMFAYVKTSVRRCTALSTGQTFFKLHKAFCECLGDYAKKLAAKLPTANQDVACYCLNTAEYCGETVEQLGEIVRSKIDRAYADRVDLEEEQDAFHDIIAAAVKKLVSLFDAKLDPSLKAMASIQWHSLDSVEEESNYVRAIADQLKTVESAKTLLSPLYFRNFCDKFVAFFLPKFYQTILSAKRINEIGTHQLLLDLHSLKPVFMTLPDQKPSNTYAKYVSGQFAKIEMVLKLVGTPTEMLVERFKIMWPDGTRNDLTSVCNLKGLKKADHQHLLDTLYGAGGVPAYDDVAGEDDSTTNRSKSQEPLSGFMSNFSSAAGGAASSAGDLGRGQFALESVSAQASLTINNFGSQMRVLINKSKAGQMQQQQQSSSNAAQQAAAGGTASSATNSSNS